MFSWKQHCTLFTSKNENWFPYGFHVKEKKHKIVAKTETTPKTLSGWIGKSPTIIIE